MYCVAQSFQDVSTGLSTQWESSRKKAYYLFENAPPLKTLYAKLERSVWLAGLVAVVSYNGGLASLLQRNRIVPLCAQLSTILSIAFLTVATAVDIQRLPNEWEVQRLTKDQSKSRVLLHCFPGWMDWNGGATRTSKNKLDILRKFSKTHSILHLPQNSIEEINRTIDQVESCGQRVDILWISTHGNPNFFTLGIQKVLKSAHSGMTFLDKIFGSTTVDKLNLSKLTPKADIVLESCSVASDLPNDLSIAEWVQHHAGPSRNVHAPVDKSLGSFIQLEKTWLGANRFKFYNLEWRKASVAKTDLKDFLKNITAKIDYFSVEKKLKNLDIR